MDKRTILFVILLTFALFGVNIMFEGQRQEKIRAWSEEVKEEQIKKQKILEAEISENSVKESDLPITNFYADAEGQKLLGKAILEGQNILALSWTDSPPETVYVQNKPFKLSISSKEIGAPLIYKGDGAKELQIGDLPELGSYFLQVVYLNSSQDQPQIYVGKYVDSFLTIPAKTLSKQKAEFSHDTSALLKLPAENAVILMKTTEGFLPIAVFQTASQKLQFLVETHGLNTAVVLPKTKPAPTDSEEKFYVINTPYQQFVFSNVGAALAEINLPFHTNEDSKSAVREIEFDREMVEKHPYNARFPAHPFYTPAKDGGTVFEKHEKGTLGGFYPLIRRDLIESNTKKTIKIAPKFYALNILSEYPELAQLVFEVKSFDNNKIVFEANQRHRRITKTFFIDPNDKQAPYTLNLTIKVEGDSRGLWLASGVPEVEWVSGSPAPALKVRITRNQKSEVELIDLPTDVFTVTSVFPDWIADSNGFLGLIVDPLTEIDPGYRVQFVSGTEVPSRLVEIEQENQRFKAQDLPGYMTLLPLKSSGGTMSFRIFAGPFSDDILKSIDKTYADPATGYNPDYIAAQSFHGWFAFISEPFAKFLFVLMNFFHTLTGSWAFSIILLTVALRIMMYPLNAWSSKSMLRMQQIAPEVTAIQEKYKKDPKQAQVEVMNLYRERGVNPMSGCLPMLIQMPFLIGMFDLLKSTVELRGASFIPGWIDNLTSPDVLFSWETPIFFIGNQFHLLPILLGLVMFLQQRLMSPKIDPKDMTDQQRQQKAMGTIMAVVFALMFYNFPSGLNIYWLSSMLLGILQQWWTARNLKPVSITTMTKDKPFKKKG